MTNEAAAETRRKEAAEWFARLNQRRVTTEDVKGFSAWRRIPENDDAFKRMEAVWDATGTLAGDPEMAALARDARSRKTISDWRRKSVSGRLVPLGFGSAVVFAIGLGSWLWVAQRPLDYATALGEQRTVQLADGSRMILDTDSRVSVRFTADRRSVTLASGQAMFEVEGDASRPFLVKAGDTEVTALGTRFDVRRSGSGARVILVEGQVAVRRPDTQDADWTLKPGEEVTTSAPAPRVVPVNVPAAISWTVGRLTFENTPISAAVAEVNRYSRHPIELRDDRVSAIRVSGAFNVGDIDGFVAALSDLYALQVSRSPEGRIILTGPA